MFLLSSTSQMQFHHPLPLESPFNIFQWMYLNELIPLRDLHGKKWVVDHEESSGLQLPVAKNPHPNKIKTKQNKNHPSPQKNPKEINKTKQQKNLKTKKNLPQWFFQI